MEDDVTSKIHTVNSLFFLKNGVCNCQWEKDVRPDYACYKSGKLKTRGFYLSLRNLVSVKIVSDVKDYSSEWAKIAASMRKYNINLRVAQAIEDHLSGKEETIKGFQIYWEKTDKPRIADFSDIVEFSIEKMVELSKNQEYGFRRHINGIKRDRSISVFLDSEGKIRYNAASEYVGCVNGDYYVMYSPTKGFYTETD